MLDRSSQKREPRLTPSQPRLDDVTLALRAASNELKRKHVAHLWVIGSVARGDAGPESDVDIVVEIEPKADVSLTAFSSLRLDMIELLGHKIDLAEWRTLSPSFAHAARHDAKQVFWQVGRDSTDLLKEILSAATDIMTFAEGLSFETFMRLPQDDSRTFRAMKNAITEIGEAVKGLSPDLRQRHPSVDWRGISGLRDVVAHQYYHFDIQRLWPMIQNELPEVILAVARELESPREAP